ncbi:MAG: 4-alpha-glucanotransferase [Candidatus Omnitrophica bacterium]|nr:4-alpha-glucanotransferase [Candidatus Omnitrophota bacterium]
MKHARSSGMLCHISSLPSSYGIGDLGPEAYKFVDWLKQAGQRYWQVLPLNPTDNSQGNSPYSSCSAFGFNTLLISPERLYRDGLLTNQDLAQCAIEVASSIIFDDVYARKAWMLDRAYSIYNSRCFKSRAFEEFCHANHSWLEDHALFVVLKNHFNQVSWVSWPVALRDRHPDALQEAALSMKDQIEREKFAQFLFYRQWMGLQEYCSRKDIGLIGDIPIYVNYDSVDVWRAPQFFKLDGSKQQTSVAGVPPDYFSKEGQRWGNPVYDWQKLQADGFLWWIARVRHNLEFFDIVRIDHFRAFAQCWEIPASEPTAVKGKWCDVPGEALFLALGKAFPELPIIAEDLGIITPDVDALKDKFKLPGMRVLMFAFHNEYKKSRDLPENYVPLSVAYTGTHDNNTIRGWFAEDITDVEKKNMLEYFGREVKADEITWVMMDRVLRSKSFLSIVPVQDILGAGAEARMNKPSTTKGNWRWRFRSKALTPKMAARLAALTVESGR